MEQPRGDEPPREEPRQANHPPPSQSFWTLWHELRGTSPRDPEWWGIMCVTASLFLFVVCAAVAIIGASDVATRVLFFTSAALFWAPVLVVPVSKIWRRNGDHVAEMPRNRNASPEESPRESPPQRRE